MKKQIINNSETDPNKILPIKYPWAQFILQDRRGQQLGTRRSAHDG